MIILVPIVILVLGLLLWALSKNPIVVKAGELMFFCGMLVFTMVAANQSVSLFEGYRGAPAARSR